MNRWIRNCGCGLLALAAFGIPAARGQQPIAPAPVAGPEAQSDAQFESPRPADPLLADALALVDQRRYPEASQKVQDYLSAHPDSAAAHYLLGYALYRENQPRKSLAEYTSAARLRKPEAGDLAVVAMDYILLRDYSDADKWLTEATGWTPGNELYWYYLGRTKYAENRFDEAIAVFDKCLKLTPHDLRAEYNLGLAYQGVGRTDDAAAAYRNAIAWEKASGEKDPQPYLDLGVLLLQEQKPGDAEPLLQDAVALDPQNPRAHEQLGQAWLQSQNLPKADAEMQDAVRLAPDIASLHFEMGRILQREGLTARAKEEFARCAALNASHSTDSAPTPNPPPQNQ
jgi:tetratricopeptide (TPR) repeat protein